MNRACLPLLACIGVLFAILTQPGTSRADDGLPPGLVHLKAIDPTITQAIRYAGPRNFTGKPVPGYQAPECIIARNAAQALRDIQAKLKSENLGLKIFDCYRPRRAVASFVRWAVTDDDRPELKQRFFPRLSKSDLFPGYIARRSGHSRGGAVDLTIMKLTNQDADNQVWRDGCGAHNGGNELDMGTGFDCFDTTSNTAATGISAEAKANRKKLLDLMRRHGFRNYAGEWWHYTFNNEPYRRAYFDFPVTAFPGG